MKDGTGDRDHVPLSPEHEEWARKRKQRTNDLAARALSLLGKAGNKDVVPSDILPKGYRSKRR